MDSVVEWHRRDEIKRGRSPFCVQFVKLVLKLPMMESPAFDWDAVNEIGSKDDRDSADTK